MKFRASLYFDIEADNQTEAEDVGRTVANFLGEIPTDSYPLKYSNVYFGGAALLIPNDVFGNNERTKNI